MSTSVYTVHSSQSFLCSRYSSLLALSLSSKMSPNTVFNRALDKARDHPEVSRRFGTPIKGYGRDHGGKREGRRNFIEHTEYKDEEDGSSRTRVRFNLEGPDGNAFVFAEVSSKMPSGEFVYCKCYCWSTTISSSL